MCVQAEDAIEEHQTSSKVLLNRVVTKYSLPCCPGYLAACTHMRLCFAHMCRRRKRIKKCVKTYFERFFKKQCGTNHILRKFINFSRDDTGPKLFLNFHGTDKGRTDKSKNRLVRMGHGTGRDKV